MIDRVSGFLQGLAPTWPDVAPLDQIRRHGAVLTYRVAGSRTIAQALDGELLALNIEVTALSFDRSIGQALADRVVERLRASPFAATRTDLRNSYDAEAKLWSASRTLALAP